MSISYRDPNFYTSSIVGGIIPIALGVAKALKLEGNPNNQRVWVFVGDMTAETGGFHEAYKYSKKFELPIQFVVEDNNMSTNTPTDETWGSKTKWEETDDVIYYQYERLYPHHGIGIWVSF
jgi:TPP-dependent pyruvate/acetoin dehydrogenase alpha subunit